ncbi:MAG TPA: zinc ribbon domain-containing protein [Gemmataceae bacterium]|nr:zinc ribbon domain-containing protein [Gemmataceae bacterium]
MPTYEYECEACGHAFDEFQSMSEPPLTKCPKCGKKKLTRLFGTGAGVIFKGSGFYETDYRSESYKKAAKADQEAAKPADANGKAADTTGKKGTSDAPAASSGEKGKKSGAKKAKSGD